MTQAEIEALAAVAEQMEQEAATVIEPAAFPYVLRGYARQLSLLVRACKTAPVPAPLSPEVQHRNEIEKAKVEMRQKKDPAATGIKLADLYGRAHAEEEAVGTYVVLRGGPNHGMAVPGLPSDAPVGAFTCFGGEVYKLAPDRNFDFDEQETQDRKKRVL